MNHGIQHRYSLPALLMVFAILATGIVAAGCFLYHSQRESCLKEASSQLDTVGHLKVSELELWRKERLVDAGIFYKNHAFVSLVGNYLERPQDVLLQEELRSWIGQLQASGKYDQATFLDAACNERIAVPDTKEPHSTLMLQKAREALRSGQPAIADFYLDEDTKKVFLSLFVPILDDRSGGQPLGVLRLKIDPSDFLYPFIQRWPTPSETAETLLIHREGNEAVFLNELRFQQNTPLVLRMPLDSTDHPAVKAALGQEGIVEGIDYRGVPVLAAMRAVPDSPWFLVSKMDVAEVYAPMHMVLWLTVFVGCVLLFGAAATLGFVWRQQHVRLYRQKYESEIRMRAITDSAQDAILMMDPQGAICYWNPMAETILGYRSDEAIGQNLHNLLVPDRYHQAHLTAMAQFARTGSGNVVGKTIKLLARRKDGREIDVALSLSAVSLNNQWHAVGILRDITAQKEMERRESLSAEVLGILNDASDFAHAIQRILTAIQRSTGFDAVGIRLRNGDDFPYFSQHGFSNDFLGRENMLTALGEDGGICRDEDGNISLECTCGLVLTGKTDSASPLFTPSGSFWTNDSSQLLDIPTEQDPRLHPRNRCIREGFCSLALVPIRANQAIVGLLQLNDRKKDRFTSDMIHFFEGIGASIGMAFLRKQTEDALRESQARYEKVVSTIPDIIWRYEIDAQGQFIASYISPVVDRLLGLPAGTIGDSFDNFFAYIYPQDLPALQKTLSSALKMIAKDIATEYRISKPDGTIRWFQSKGSAYLQPDGQVVAFGITSDITDHKQAERSLRQSEEELKRTVAALISANKALEESNHSAESATRAKSQFLANMSHEIRTPMTAILGCADLLISEKGLEKAPPRRRQNLETIKRNGEHLLGLINDILDLSKIEAGKMRIERTRCSPFELIAEVVSLMRVRAESKQLKLVTDFAGPLPQTVLVDSLRLRQVLVNLIGNAIKFTDQGEIRITAELTAEDDPPRLRFNVSDTGIGMNQEQVKGLFQAFSQVDSSAARKFGGTGLGLCICKRLTEAMGGTIKVTSTPGEGSTFSITIDPGPLEGIRMIEEEKLPVIAQAAVPVTGGKIELHCHVLLAEDGPDNQRLIRIILEDAGAEVTGVENGQLAVETALNARQTGNPVDVILMDMQMPIMDGYTATRELRSQGYTAPIIALTAHAMAEDRQKCLDAGCDDFAAKPIDCPLLLATVARWATRSLADRPTARDDTDASAKNQDQESLRSNYADNPVISRVLPEFVRCLDARVQSMRTALAGGQFDELQRLAHQLKGAGGSYGYPSMTDAAKTLECDARDGRGEDARASLEKVAASCRAAVQGLEPQRYCPPEHSITLSQP